MAPPHQNSLEDARRLLANCILIRGLQENGASDAPRNDAMFRTWLFVGIHSECAGQYSDANGSAGPIKTGAATHLRPLSFDRYRQPLRRCAAARANEGRPCVAQYPPRPAFGDCRARCSSEKTDYQARNAIRVQTRASQPSKMTSGAYVRSTRFRFHGYATMTPKRTGRAPSHGKDRATAANANTTERSATLLETSFSMTTEASPVFLISTNSSRSV